MCQFPQISRIKPLVCRIFHPDCQDGLASARKRLPNLHSMSDDKPVFWPFLALSALDHFFQASDMKNKKKGHFWDQHEKFYQF